MSKKTAIFIGMFIGSSLGSYVVTLFGADIFSAASVLGYFFGGIFGMWAAYKLF